MKMVSRQNPFQEHPIGLSPGLPFILLLTILLLPLGKTSAEDKMVIGEVEEVILKPWGVRLPARIDTGAATSSLDARNLTVKNNTAEFRLSKKYGSLQLRLPVIGWQKIRSADFRERRPVVEITFCMGPKLIRAEVTLNDRSTVSYPLIIGRNVLRDNFVVDCVNSNCLPPSCPEVPSQ
ncbi:MAG TPA: RimK/LysX family protein [Thermodesulfobacteriota bacterium]|nr:RimK/LysX family protein [Thermodesulfobacteriota bacterium]